MKNLNAFLIKKKINFDWFKWGVQALHNPILVNFKTD